VAGQDGWLLAVGVLAAVCVCVYVFARAPVKQEAPMICDLREIAKLANRVPDGYDLRSLSVETDRNRRAGG
jgi:hypothetical protein